LLLDFSLHRHLRQSLPPVRRLRPTAGATAIMDGSGKRSARYAGTMAARCACAARCASGGRSSTL